MWATYRRQAPDRLVAARDQSFAHRFRGEGAMRDLVLLLGRELADGPAAWFFGERLEDRVVAEAAFAARTEGDAALEGAVGDFLDRAIFKEDQRALVAAGPLV